MVVHVVVTATWEVETGAGDPLSPQEFEGRLGSIAGKKKKRLKHFN
jgi:hypothetical protein